jgi:RHS repeat-associated protein
MRVKKVFLGASATYYIGPHFEIKDGLATKYIFAGNLRIARVTASDTNYFHKDHLGSSTIMTNSMGEQVEATEYLPFGQMRSHSGAKVSDYKFTDQEFDVETGLYNYNARLYDPVIGRFISADTIVQNPSDPQMLNRYSYVRNNPLIYIDPSGHHLGGYNGPDNNGDGTDGYDFVDNGGNRGRAETEAAGVTLNYREIQITGDLYRAWDIKVINSEGDRIISTFGWGPLGDAFDHPLSLYTNELSLDKMIYSLVTQPLLQTRETLQAFSNAELTNLGPDTLIASGLALAGTGSQLAVKGAGIMATGGPAGWIGGGIVTGVGLAQTAFGGWAVYQGWQARK